MSYGLQYRRTPTNLARRCRRKRAVIVSYLLLALLFAIPISLQAELSIDVNRARDPLTDRGREANGKLPLSFEANERRQSDPQLKLLANGPAGFAVKKQIPVGIAFRCSPQSLVKVRRSP